MAQDRIEAEAQRLAPALDRLIAMREAAGQLMARDQIGRDRFKRGQDQAAVKAGRLEALARAYAAVLRRRGPSDG